MKKFLTWALIVIGIILIYTVVTYHYHPALCPLHW